MADESVPSPRSRSFWSGTISFGLVSVRIELFPANRPRQTRLRMVDEDGTPLRHQYVCPEEEEPVPEDEIVRGFETDDGELVLVTDEELESLEPEKTRAIDLREFVPREQLDPVFFRRGYFLAPAEDSRKAYALLATAMEDSGRAGVATFVMRGTEYLVAIVAEDGILRAETMRFAAEIRAPADVGLPEPEDAPKEVVESVAAAIRNATREELAEEELRDRYAERLDEKVEEKREKGEDVAELPAEVTDAREGEKVVDLMEALKASLEGSDGTRRGLKRAARKEKLPSRTRKELYERARELEIPGRSKMNKDELIKAIQR